MPGAALFLMHLMAINSFTQKNAFFKNKKRFPAFWMTQRWDVDMLQLPIIWQKKIFDLDIFLKFTEVNLEVILAEISQLCTGFDILAFKVAIFVKHYLSVSSRKLHNGTLALMDKNIIYMSWDWYSVKLRPVVPTAQSCKILPLKCNPL